MRVPVDTNGDGRYKGWPTCVNKGSGGVDIVVQVKEAQEHAPISVTHIT